MREIVTRAQWGDDTDYSGRPDAYLPADGTFTHHTAGVRPDPDPPEGDDYEAVRRVLSVCRDRFGDGMCYTFLIAPSGLIFEGHPVGKRGIHTACCNTTHRGVAHLGNYMTVDPTPAQIDAHGWLLAEGVRRGWWRTVTTRGHRDVAATDCPGDRLYGRLRQIEETAKAYLEGEGTMTPEDITAIADAVWNRRIVNPDTGNARDADEYLAAAGNHAYAAHMGVNQLAADLAAGLAAMPAAVADEVARRFPQGPTADQIRAVLGEALAPFRTLLPGE